MNEKRTRKCLWQLEHIRGDHFRHIFSVTVGDRKTFEVMPSAEPIGTYCEKQNSEI
jgi:hypothetical protein